MMRQFFRQANKRITSTARAAAASSRTTSAFEVMGRSSIRKSRGMGRTPERAIALGKRRAKYMAGGAAGLALYSSAMSDTRYDKKYGSSGRYGLNPRSSGGFA